MTTIRDVVFDCHHPASLARFWVSVLDDYAVAPYDDEELERLRRRGIDDPEDDPAVLVEAPRGSPRLWFQLVPESKSVKNRVHLDLGCDDADVEVKRLLELGARELARPDGNEGLIVMCDPEGNEFCVLR
ncbi:MAG: VOC family protein [Actinomycetota bacterium]